MTFEELCNSTVSTSKLVLIRDVTRKECSWLPRDFKTGEHIYEYHGYCYGVIGPSGIACTLIDGETTFYEFPKNSVSSI